MALKNVYLLGYNGISLALWSYLTYLTLSLYPTFYAQSRARDLYPRLLSPLLTFTQSLAFLEIIHAASGIVRASLVTTAIQVVGKNLVVWTVMVRFPEIFLEGGSGGIWAFVGCLLSWGASEIVRYGYFVGLLLGKGECPSWLKWLRYSAFIFLYPPGIFSEASLVYMALMQATNVNLWFRVYLLLGLLAYVPAGYILYTHMLAQRRRVLRDPSKGQK